MDARKIFAAARRQGWRIVKTRRNHYRLTPPGDGPILTHSSTPSDVRAVRNLLAEMRGQGFEFPR